MIRFAAIRLVEVGAMLILMSFVIYGLIGLMPGDPIDLMRSADPRTSAADVARLKAVYGLDRPLVARYFAWAGGALRSMQLRAREGGHPEDPGDYRPGTSSIRSTRSHRRSGSPTTSSTVTW